MRLPVHLTCLTAAAALLVASCTTVDEEDQMSTSTVSAAPGDAYCGVLDADLIEQVLPGVKISQRGVPLSPRLGERDPRGNCTLDGPDGRPVLWVAADASGTTYADQLRSRDEWQAETMDGPEGVGWSGRLGPGQDAGGYAVLEREDTIVSVTLHEAGEGRDAAADALQVARAALDDLLGGP